MDDLLEKQTRELQDLGESTRRGHVGRGWLVKGRSLRGPQTQQKSLVMQLCLYTGYTCPLELTVVFTPVYLLIH